MRDERQRFEGSVARPHHSFTVAPASDSARDEQHDKRDDDEQSCSGRACSPLSARRKSGRGLSREWPPSGGVPDQSRRRPRSDSYLLSRSAASRHDAGERRGWVLWTMQDIFKGFLMLRLIGLLALLIVVAVVLGIWSLTRGSDIVGVAILAGVVVLTAAIGMVVARRRSRRLR